MFLQARLVGSQYFAALATRAGLTLAILFASAGIAVADVPSETAPAPRGVHLLIGSASCSAGNCHGGTTSPWTGPLYASHRIWLTHDKHATAYDVLFQQRSLQMIERLGVGWAPAHQEHRCLACHAHVESETEKHAPSFQVSDGVSCESCHGPAEKWVYDHSRRELWDSYTASQKAALGFHEVGNFTQRAEKCVLCHVGAADREVNHDMIAAGHPRLAFELAGFSAIYKKHWRLEEDHRRAAGIAGGTQSDLEAELWITGQIVAAKQAVQLTRVRAERAAADGGNGKAPWPEFTEYSCFSCHHELRDDSARQYGPFARRFGQTDVKHWDQDPPGTYNWQSWLLANAVDVPPVDAAWSKALGDLRKQVRLPYPDPQTVMALCDVVQRASSDNRTATDHLNLQQLTALLDWATSDRYRYERSWEAAAQNYLSVTALTAAIYDLRGAPAADRDGVRAALNQYRVQLAFPKQQESPSDLDSARLAQIHDAVNRIRQEFSLNAVAVRSLPKAGRR